MCLNTTYRRVVRRFWRAVGGTSVSFQSGATHPTSVCSPGWRRSTSRAASSDVLTGRKGRLPLAGGAAGLLCAAAEPPPQLEGASTVAAMLCTAAGHLLEARTAPPRQAVGARRGRHRSEACKPNPGPHPHPHPHPHPGPHPHLSPFTLTLTLTLTLILTLGLGLALTLTRSGLSEHVVYTRSRS